MPITISTPTVVAVAGVPILISGTVLPEGDFVSIGLSTSPTVPPTSTVIVGGVETRFSVYLTPTTDATTYVWAQQLTVEGNVPGLLASLRYSDTRGRSWQEPITQSLGREGQFYTNVQWRRLGLARDRVFELSWTMSALTGLNGAFIDVTEGIS